MNSSTSSGSPIRPVLLLGAGGHARVLIDLLKTLDLTIIGAVDASLERRGQTLDGVPILGGDDVVQSFAVDELFLVNAVGSTASTALRKTLFQTWKERGYTFTQLIHPNAVVARTATLDEGAQVLASCVIGPAACISANSIVNTAAVVEHDCTVGAHVHVATGAYLAGNVRVAQGAHIGIGATLIQGIEVGEDAIIGAGAVVIRNVAPHTTVAGVPAKLIREPG